MKSEDDSELAALSLLKTSASACAHVNAGILFTWGVGCLVVALIVVVGVVV